MKLFFVSHQGQQVGPISLEAVIAKITAGELTMLDYIYDEPIGQWVTLMECDFLTQQLKAQKPNTPPPPPTDSLSKSLQAEWYVLKGESKFGPFIFTDVVKMLQKKIVFEFDFAWQPKMDGWKRIAEIEDFKAQNIQTLKESLMPEIEEVFFRRKHRRSTFKGVVLVHDNQTVWKGQGYEISAGGAGVVMDNALVVPGQKLYVHFKPAQGLPPFNAVCEVVSKKYVDGLKEKNAPIQYGLKFTEVNTQTQEFLQSFIQKEAA